MRGNAARRLIRVAGEHADRFCEHWIGWSLPPVAHALHDAQWEPTPRSDYCRRCGQSVGEGEASVSGCAACRGVATPTDGIVRLGSYSETLREWILQVKYDRWTEMGRRLGVELARAIVDADIVDLPQTVVVPMPMPWIRQARRGIDHAEVIARGVADALGVPLARVLSKTNGPTQLAVPRSARRVNARRGMRVRRRWGGWPLTGLHIVVVDDVRTTGSSMNAAARLLRSLGAARIVEAVVAVADTGGRGLKSTRGEPEEVPIEDFSPV